MKESTQATGEVAALRALVDLQRARRRRVSKKLREKIMERDGHACFYCGSNEELQVDHVVAVAAGGLDDESNLVTACAGCNHDKRASSTSARKERLINKRMRLG